MLHRPGLELQRLTPSTARELLFDGVLWVGRARAGTRRVRRRARASRGVEIVYLDDLLADVLEQPAVRADPRADASTPICSDRPSAPRCGRGSWPCPRRELAQHLVAGVTFDELPFASDSIVARMQRGYVAAPLPNTLFMRDTSAWIYGGVSVNTMAKPARVRESLHLQAIYEHHPVFRDAEFEMWSDGDGPMFLEGGDALVIGNGAVLVGMGERTHPAAVETARTATVPSRCGHAGDRGGDPIAALEHAPRHRAHDARCRCVHGVPRCARRHDHLRGHARRRTAWRWRKLGPVRRDRAARWRCRRSGSSRPGVTDSRPSGSSGTTATTCSRSPRASSWPTSGTSTPTRRLRDGGIEVIVIDGEELGRGRGGPAVHELPDRARRDRSLSRLGRGCRPAAVHPSSGRSPVPRGIGTR